MSFQRVRNTEAEERKVFLERLRSLDQIRAQIYLSGTYARDFLLSPDPDTAKAQAGHLATLKRQTHKALDAYQRGLEPEEQKPFVSLRNEIDAYWRVLDATIGWSPEERNRLRYSFFYNELVPRRTSMLQIADRITSVNEQGLMRSDDAGVRLGQRPGAILGRDIYGYSNRWPGSGAIDDRFNCPARARTRPCVGRICRNSPHCFCVHRRMSGEP